MARQVFLIRHGETEWSRTGLHTGRTDVPLTDEGRLSAQRIGRSLQGREMMELSSPLSRARETCRLAGFGDGVEIVDDLREWDYGIYEGRSTAEIRRDIPNWSVWDSPIVNGESIEQVAARAQQVIARVLAASDHDFGLFAHGHILRILAACWVGLPPVAGRLLALDTGSISTLGYEHQTRVIRQWNLVPPL